MYEGIKYHAVREFRQNQDEDDFCVEEIRQIGYTVIPSGYSDDELQLIREKLDAIYATQIEELGGADKLKAINDANVARCTVEYDDYFVKLAAHPRLLSIGRKLMAAPFILMSQNGIINRPDDEHYQVTWHRDLNYQHFVSSRPLAMSALYCIDPFSDVTGATAVIPASHTSEAFPSPEYIRKHETTVNAPAGSIIVFDAMLYHRSGYNRSGKLRRGVNHIYTLPLIKQQIDIPKVLKGKYKDDPELGPLLGYGTESGEGVLPWRQNKMAIAEQRRKSSSSAN
jgi:ectoine hydroxylase-related dioxygenase (phytanoyl-CoA dioxygenase family)